MDILRIHLTSFKVYLFLLITKLLGIRIELALASGRTQKHFLVSDLRYVFGTLFIDHHIAYWIFEHIIIYWSES